MSAGLGLLWWLSVTLYIPNLDTAPVSESAPSNSLSPAAAGGAAEDAEFGAVGD